MLEPKFALFFKFRGRREVLAKIRSELGADAGARRAENAQGAQDQPLFDGDDFARVNVPRWFGWLAVDFNGAGPTGIGCEGTRLEQADRPKPLVEPRAGEGRVRVIEVRKQATANL